MYSKRKPPKTYQFVILLCPELRVEPYAYAVIVQERPTNKKTKTKTKKETSFSHSFSHTYLDLFLHLHFHLLLLLLLLHAIIAP